MSAGTSNPLASLYTQGQKLKTLLRNTPTDTTGQEVEESIRVMLEKLKRSQSDSIYIQESIKKLMIAFKATLQNFITHDPNNKSLYEKLVMEVSSFKEQGSEYSDKEKQSEEASSTHQQASEDLEEPEDDFDFNAAYEALSDKEKQCLGCFLLFPADAVIKKRELIHCWLGLNLIEPSGEEAALARLVGEGLIDPIIRNKKLSSRYKMPQRVREWLDDAQQGTNNASEYEVPGGSWSILLKQQDPAAAAGSNSNGREKQFGRTYTLLHETSPNPGTIEALLNIKQITLNEKRFEKLSKMNNLKVLHLGTWSHDVEKYVVVEDSDIFKDFKNLNKVQFLSLEGVSGIVRLPKAIYNLDNLKVLDLRACHNLEILPQGIESLKKLTHLDLSGCFLLDHIPRGIMHLTSLQVLYGFIIGKEDPKDENPSRRDRKPGGILREVATPSQFRDLSDLKNLAKLTVRTRRMDFPARADLETLQKMGNLNCLRIRWVGDPNGSSSHGDLDPQLFPMSLKKLELQAATHQMAQQLMCLIGKATDNQLEKLYLRGGCLYELKQCLPLVKVVRLRHLPKLHVDWDAFRESFPNLSRLELSKCPNLNFFPCDESGVWEGDEIRQKGRKKGFGRG